MDGYIFDMDGVIWDGERGIPHAADTINQIMELGKRVVFVTNNARRSRDSYVRRLARFGIKTSKKYVITSSHAAAMYILKRNGKSRVYAMGTKDLRSEIKEVGHRIVRKKADFVVAGLDLNLNYRKMAIAVENLLDGAKLVACAPDLTYLEGGRIWPGTGAFVKALEAASGKRGIVVGKPHREIMDIGIEILGVERGRCIIVGDKVNTDIAAGKNAGIKTALVLTGETTETGGRALKGRYKPDYVLENLQELLKIP